MAANNFIPDIRTSLRSLQIDFVELSKEPFPVFLFKSHPLAIQFIPVNCKTLSKVQPAYFSEAIEQYHNKGISLINIWEDVWHHKSEIVMSRIRSLLGITQRVYARQTIVKRIDKKDADLFLKSHHLMGTANMKFKYGLFYKNDLISVAGFSGGRTMTKSANTYRSYEMVRFANAMGITVIGGLSKMIKTFTEEVQPGDIMTYIDRDWSDGRSYRKLGFQLKEITPPQSFYINEKEPIRYYPHRLPENFNEKSYFKIYNSGNMKLVKGLELAAKELK